ncbi:MAG: FHA domain-containing protein, partial [Actinomycetota bacterium]|nr:FHA domain-containing protein [Actinomycetota bacterium]
MSRPVSPALTVRHDGSTRTFAAGNDVVVGRDLRADVRIAHPLISRAHLLLRFDQGRWIAVDNGSLNGMFVNGRRVPTVDIADGQQVHLGNPDGPLLTFEVGRHQGSAGRPPSTTSIHVAGRSGGWPGQPAPTPPPPVSPPPAGYPSGPRPYPTGPTAYPPSTAPPPRPAAHSAPQPAPPHSAAQPAGQHPISAPAMESATVMGPAAAPRSGDGNIATSMLRILR